VGHFLQLDGIQAVSLEQWSAIFQILGACVGIPSLIFVGIQLRLAARAVRAASSQAHTMTYFALSDSLIENSNGFVSTWNEGLGGTENPSCEERVRFFAFISSLLRFFASERIQWLRKQLYREHWRAIERQAEFLAAQPGVREFWSERRHWHCVEFQSWFDALIEHEGEDRVTPENRVMHPL
jgi:hypothetical protein